ncbi:cobalt/nickel transport system permease protein [Stackebrandtia albiflava]|uniref:Cobalt/nickel transport system permease protein n=1 Tax=Stackebrandtia albiflava TaxID=406432 RepID=A0A562URM9_9ACTN|nr:cobalt ECF transporter T component CbiQ [Stackebrandtia albiflava]TWJ08258.1 cobalt/nickel transport system permease protein [Stackebrandtia albiflava]
MTAGHPDALYVPGDSPVHRLPGEVKIVAVVLYVVTVVATPATEVAAFAGYAAPVAAVVIVSRLDPLPLARRALIEVPFLLLAVLLPFLSTGPRVEWLGLTLSEPGLWAAWNIVAKATLGVWAAVLLAATTDVTSLLTGLQRLRCPTVIVQIVTFMVRYVHVLLDEAHRMRIARLSRGDDPRFLWQVRATAAGFGALFLRAFERGERVYVAMLSRGYTGRMPVGAERPAARVREWAAGALLPATAVTIAVTATVA